MADGVCYVALCAVVIRWVVSNAEGSRVRGPLLRNGRYLAQGAGLAVANREAMDRPLTSMYRGLKGSEEVIDDGEQLGVCVIVVALHRWASPGH